METGKSSVLFAGDRGIDLAGDSDVLLRERAVHIFSMVHRDTRILLWTGIMPLNFNQKLGTFTTAAVLSRIFP